MTTVYTLPVLPAMVNDSFGLSAVPPRNLSMRKKLGMVSWFNQKMPVQRGKRDAPLFRCPLIQDSICLGFLLAESEMSESAA
jgi:hypothetical protein